MPCRFSTCSMFSVALATGNSTYFWRIEVGYYSQLLIGFSCGWNWRDVEMTLLIFPSTDIVSPSCRSCYLNCRINRPWLKRSWSSPHVSSTKFLYGRIFGLSSDTYYIVIFRLTINNTAFQWKGKDIEFINTQVTRLNPTIKLYYPLLQVSRKRWPAIKSSDETLPW